MVVVNNDVDGRGDGKLGKRRHRRLRLHVHDIELSDSCACACDLSRGHGIDPAL